MVDNRAEEMRQKAKEKTDEMESEVKENVVKIERSKVGKTMPTHIEKVEFRDIMFFTLIMVAALTIPAYLMVDGNLAETTGKIKYFLMFVKWTLVFTGLLGVVFDAVMVMMKLEVLLKIIIIMKVFKAVALLLAMWALKSNGMISKSLLVLYLAATIAGDAIFLYYSILYFNRLKSDDYDDQGNPKQSNTENKS